MSELICAASNFNISSNRQIGKVDWYGMSMIPVSLLILQIHALKVSCNWWDIKE